MDRITRCRECICNSANIDTTAYLGSDGLVQFAVPARGLYRLQTPGSLAPPAELVFTAQASSQFVLPLISRPVVSVSAGACSALLYCWPCAQES